MPSHACLFEAKSIQDYILRSGRLRHIIGASELLESLTPKLVDEVLAALGRARGRDLRFSRAAGGAVYLFADDAGIRDEFRDLWSIAVRQYAPGLEFVLVTGDGASDYDAYEDAQKHMHAARNRQPPLLPAGTPVTCYASRTGEPAVSSHAKLGLQDQATTRFGRDEFWRHPLDGLTARFSAALSADDWPRNLDYDPEDPDNAEFPFLQDNRYLALLHADGNGLGQILIELQKYAEANPDRFVPLFWDFSQAVSGATVAAARGASDAVLLPVRQPAADDGPGASNRLIPARPIVLGGDDLTILLRADLALPFARAFLTRFEAESEARLTEVRAKHPGAAQALPERLTAGGGIAFVKSNHPFHLAHELAEAIAKRAKDQAKAVKSDTGRIPPTLAFHRVTSAFHGDFKSILDTEMTAGAEGARVQTTLVAYGLDADGGGLPALADVEALVALLRDDDLARGPARQLLTLIGQDHDEAARRYRRWQEVMRTYAPKSGKTHPLDEMQSLLGRLCGELADDLPVAKHGTPRRTPLGDVTTLLAVAQGAEHDKTAIEPEAE